MPSNTTKPKKASSAKTKIPDQLLLRKVNESTNPLTILPQVCDNKEGILKAQVADLMFDVKFCRWNEITDEVKEWMLNLTEDNMRGLYEDSKWGWSRQLKQSEFKNAKARFLLINSALQEPESDLAPFAFVHFRFEEGYSSDAVLYCYELQVEEQYRRRGVGKYLMDLLARLAQVYRMKKVLLTVLKTNVDAFEFYTKGLGFKIDKASPSRCGGDADYEILMKPVVANAAASI